MTTEAIREYANSMARDFESRGLRLKPFPKVSVKREPRDPDDPFVDTGNYSPETNTITLYVEGRHIKDVLRTLAHELVHVHQHRSSPEQFSAGVGTDLGNDETLRLEAQAYAIGNLLFREWTVHHGHG